MLPQTLHLTKICPGARSCWTSIFFTGALASCPEPSRTAASCSFGTLTMMMLTTQNYYLIQNTLICWKFEGIL